VAGVCVVEMTVLVQVPNMMTSPAVEAEQSAQPMTVLDPAVQAANCCWTVLCVSPEAAALMSAAAMDLRA
jgi:hypothetical protein